MKLLLDTHSFLWLDMQPQALSAAALAACESPDNELYLSLVSVWEIQIKMQLNKLSLRVSLDQMLDIQQLENGLQILPITLPHIRELSVLPLHHKDPFDRLLIAQARIEGTYLISADGVFKNYPVNHLW